MILTPVFNGIFNLILAGTAQTTTVGSISGVAPSSQLSHLQVGSWSHGEEVTRNRAMQGQIMQQTGEFGDDLRRMNSERVKLDEELRSLENKEIKEFVDEQVCCQSFTPICF